MGKDHDDHLLERLLDGRLPADDVPQDLADAGRLLETARAVPPVDPVVARATVAAMVEVVHASPQPPPLTRRSPVLARLLTTKAAAAAAVLTLSATGAAAATGSVPESVVAFLDDIGIQVPARAVKVVQATTTTASPTTAPPTTAPPTTAPPTSVPAAGGHDEPDDDAERHGEDVSTVARSTEACHGKAVSEAARDRDDDGTTSTTVAGQDTRPPCAGTTSTVPRPAAENRRGDGGRGDDDADRDRDRDSDERDGRDSDDRRGDDARTDSRGPGSP